MKTMITLVSILLVNTMAWAQQATTLKISATKSPFMTYSPLENYFFEGRIKLPSTITITSGYALNKHDVAQLTLDNIITCDYRGVSHRVKELRFDRCSNGAKSGEWIEVRDALTLQLNRSQAFFTATTISQVISAEELYDDNPQVVQGPAGPQGPQGLQGIQGEKGDKGDRGEQGLQGIQGLAGIKGDKGDRGEQGIQGVAGIDGAIGAPGANGAPGIQGEKGEKGDKGDSASSLIAVLKDIKAKGTHAGSCYNDKWSIRDLNNQSGDGSFISLSSNKFILQAGRYLIEGTTPAYFTGMHKTRLVRSTGSVIEGVASYAQPTYTSNAASTVTAIVTVEDQEEFHLEDICQNNKEVFGLGAASNLGESEVYSVVKITKLE